MSNYYNSVGYFDVIYTTQYFFASQFSLQDIIGGRLAIKREHNNQNNLTDCPAVWHHSTAVGTHLLSVVVVDDQLAVSAAAEGPVAHHQARRARLAEHGLRRRVRPDRGARALQLLQKLAPVVRAVRAALRAARAVHGGQLTVQDEPDRGIRGVNAGQCDGRCHNGNETLSDIGN